MSDEWVDADEFKIQKQSMADALQREHLNEDTCLTTSQAHEPCLETLLSTVGGVEGTDSAGGGQPGDSGAGRALPWPSASGVHSSSSITIRGTTRTLHE